jgi:hypothetical protein
MELSIKQLHVYFIVMPAVWQSSSTIFLEDRRKDVGTFCCTYDEALGDHHEELWPAEDSVRQLTAMRSKNQLIQ